MKFLHMIDIQVAHVFLNFQKNWIYGSMGNVQITIDCSIFDRFYFRCIVSLFWWIYQFIYQWIKPWKSYITVDTMQKQNMNWFATVLIVVICFIILTDLTKVLLSSVWLNFSSFGWDHDGWRNKERQETKLGATRGTPR